MGAPLTEFTLESILRDGLGDLRSNPDKLDDLFSKFTTTFFNNQYGINQIESLKTYIQENQIKIVHAFSQIPMSTPCFSIQLLSSSEREYEQQFGNDEFDVDESKDRNIIVAGVTPSAYDTVSGKLSIAGGVNLSAVCPGMIFIDNTNQEFIIGTGNSNLSGNKYINIGSGKTPSQTGSGTIVSSVDFQRQQRGFVRLREIISIGCHSKDNIHLSKYLYYILYFILKSRQSELINRGINLDKGDGGIFDRDDAFAGENIYSRFMQLTCLTEFTWDKELANILDCFELDIKVPTPDPDSEDTISVNTSPED